MNQAINGLTANAMPIAQHHVRNDQVSEETYTKVTMREKQILFNLCEGFSSKEIGHKLFISPHTVETHKRNLMSKLNARNTVHLAVLAIKKGLTSVPQHMTM